MAVRRMSPVEKTLNVVEPFAGRFPAAPEMMTWSAPVVAHVAVTRSGAQPVEGVIANELMTGAVEKAPRETDSARLLPSPERLSFLMAYGSPAPFSMRKRSASCDSSAVAGSREASDCCAAEPGTAKIWAAPTGAPPSKAATSTVQGCEESGLHRTPTFVRARPGSVDDDASAPPPHDSSPAARKSEIVKAVFTVPKRPAGASLNVSDQAFTGASLVRW